jgi:hypothetical protein
MNNPPTTGASAGRWLPTAASARKNQRCKHEWHCACAERVEGESRRNPAVEQFMHCAERSTARAMQPGQCMERANGVAPLGRIVMIENRDGAKSRESRYRDQNAEAHRATKTTTE